MQYPDEQLGEPAELIGCGSFALAFGEEAFALLGNSGDESPDMSQSAVGIVA